MSDNDNDRPDDEGGDYKSLFNRRIGGRAYEYRVVHTRKDEPGKTDTWIVALFVGEQHVSTGEAGKKRSAEQRAARGGLAWLDGQEDWRERVRRRGEQGKSETPPILLTIQARRENGPDWRADVRKSTAEEQKQGADLVLETSMKGTEPTPLFVRIEGSTRSELRFALSHPEATNTIGLITLQKQSGTEEFYERLVQFVEFLRRP